VTAEGYSASATPAAFAIESAPFTRVVFLVAMAGKPMALAASGVVLATPRGSGWKIALLDPHPHSKSVRANVMKIRFTL
jgi:hypothetical protein